MHRILSALLALSASVLPALAEDAATRVANAQKFGAWTVACKALAMNETACMLDQALLRNSDRAFVANILGFWDARGEKRYLTAQVPVGAYLPSGFAMRVGDDKTVHQFIWQSCTSTLCEALIELDDDTLKALGAPGAQVVASYRPNLRSDPVVFNFSAEGIAEGLAALRPAEPAKDKKATK